MTDYHATPYDWEQARVNEAPFGSGDDYLSHMLNHGSATGMAEDLCPTRASVLGLAVTCAMLVVLYVCTVFCVCIRRTAMARSACSSEPHAHFFNLELTCTKFIKPISVS